MSYVFDASSICTSVKKGKAVVLRENSTTKLTEFELDNASERT